jgi:hypothetical protein
MATLSKINSNFSKITLTDSGGNILSLNLPQNLSASNVIAVDATFTTANFSSAIFDSIITDNLTTNGISTFPNVANIIIAGGLNGQQLISNGSGGVYWGNYIPNSIVNGTSNVRVLNNGNVTISVNSNPNVVVVSDNSVSINSNLSVGNINVANNISVLGNSDLGSNSNVTMRGGEFGWLLTTDGNGQLFWKDPCQLGCGGGGGTTAGVNQIIAGNNITISPALGTGVVTIDADLEIQPQIVFTAPINGFAQSFINPNIATFQNNTYALVSVNGVIQNPSDYVITGTTLTITNNLNVGDIVQIGPTGGGGAGGTGTVTQVVGNGGGLGFTLTGTVTSNGNITLNTPTALDLRNTLNIGNVSLINLNGNGSTYLSGDGLWKQLSGFPGGPNSAIQFNNNGVFDGSPSATYDGANILASVKTTALYQTKITMVTNTIDLSQGSFFSRTITSPTTFSVLNIPLSGVAASFVLELNNGGSFPITWWSGVQWPNGVNPPLTPSGRDSLGFYTHDGGITWTGLLLGRDIK